MRSRERNPHVDAYVTVRSRYGAARIACGACARRESRCMPHPAGHRSARRASRRGLPARTAAHATPAKPVQTPVASDRTRLDVHLAPKHAIGERRPSVAP